MPSVPPRDLFPYFRTIEDLGAGPLDWAAFWGNDRPVELEVGTGRGLFLFNAGQKCPDINFLGNELDFSEGRRAAKRIAKIELGNVRIVGGNARELLPKFVADHSLAAVHVYFPDPWWKRRHHKHRIFNDWFVAEVARVLKPGGLLHAWTDVAEYFEVIVSLVNSHPEYVQLPPPEERAAEHDLDYHTSYERKKRQAGLPIHRARWERRPIGMKEPAAMTSVGSVAADAFATGSNSAEPRVLDAVSQETP